MAVEPTNEYVRADTNRKVWILNSDTEPYREKFRGEVLVIPPNEKREVLRPYLAAERFLSQPVALAELLPNGKPAPGKPRGKPLKLKELTDTEKEMHDPKSLSADQKEALKQAEKEIAEASTATNRETGVLVEDDTSTVPRESPTAA